MKKRKSKSKTKRPPAKPAARRRSASVIVGRPDTFPAGVAMDARGWPAHSLVIKRPHPKAAASIARELERRQEAEAKQGEIAEQARRVQIDQPLGDGRLDLKWAKGLLKHLPADMRGLIDRQADAFTREQVGWMAGMDDHWQESEKVRAIVLMGIEAGFAVALARFREPLMQHAPAARELIDRLDANRKRGTETTKAKPVKARDSLRELIKAARSQGREVTVEEVMKALKCSRTTAWRRMTEIELQPRR